MYVSRLNVQPLTPQCLAGAPLNVWDDPRFEPRPNVNCCSQRCDSSHRALRSSPKGALRPVVRGVQVRGVLVRGVLV